MYQLIIPEKFDLIDRSIMPKEVRTESDPVRLELRNFHILRQYINMMNYLADIMKQMATFVYNQGPEISG